MRFFGSLVALLVGASAVTAVPNPIKTKPQPHDRKLKMKDFEVSSHVPGIPFPLGRSWAGNLPISPKKNEPRQLFFWTFPASEAVGHDDLVIWLNGPGCSSLEGLFQENGPFMFPFNKTKAERNPWAWTRLSNVIWIEQPAGNTGFAKGDVSVRNEEDVAREFYGFLVEFFKVFKSYHGKKLWFTGESYAGKYIPYMADYIYAQRGAKAAGINLQGIAINDPSFAEDIITEELPSLQFAKEHAKFMNLSPEFLAKLEAKAEKAGIADYVDKHLVYPPKGLLPKPNLGDFSPFSEIIDESTRVNPCFNIYDVSDAYSRCPGVSDVLGYPPDKAEPSATNILNNQTGLKEAIHADPNNIWLECRSPFVDGKDLSPGPSESGVLTRVIEKSPVKRTVIQHGLRDFVLIANGSALAIQNTTWNGKQGFQTKPDQALITINGTVAGQYHTERGLTFVEIINSGHMVPQDDPPTAFKLQKYFLGQLPEKALGKHWS